MPRFRTLAALSLAWTWLMSACSEPEPPVTQLVVRVDSDFTPQFELAHVKLRVSSHADRTLRVVANPSSLAETGAERSTLMPFSFGVEAPRRSLEGPVLIEVQGMAPDGKLIAHVRARVHFKARATRELSLSLRRDCDVVFSHCRETQTCRDRQCVSYDVDIGSLRDVIPGGEFAGGPPLAPTTPPETPPSDTPLTQRNACGQNIGYYADVGRSLSRTLDGNTCPIASINEQWGDIEASQERNIANVRSYLVRALEVDADIVILNIKFVDGLWMAYGLPRYLASQANKLAPLQDALAAPGLREADQPLTLLLEDPSVRDDEAMAEQLIATFATAGVVSPCRPIYLIALGDTREVLRRVRDLLETRAALALLRPLVHLGVTIYAASPDVIVDWMDRALQDGFDLVRYDMLHPAWPLMFEQARRRGLAVSMFNAASNYMLPALCGFGSVIEQFVLPERPEAERADDEIRRFTARSRVMLELDVHEAADLGAVSYGAAPDVSQPRAIALDGKVEQLPTLELSGAGNTAAGCFLAFTASKRQRLALHEVDDDQADAKYTAPRGMSLALLARFKHTTLKPGEREVLVSKRGDASGWSLEHVNVDGMSSVRFTHYGRHNETGHITEHSVTVVAPRADVEDEAVHFIYAQAIGASLHVVLDRNEQLTAGTDAAYDAVPNDLPVTLGADADEPGGFLEGGVQKLRIVALH